MPASPATAARIALAASLAALLSSALPAQEPASPLDESLAKLIHWRMVGPDRGGRSAAVAGHADQPLTYYFGACGGGVWKTSDGGQHWRCVSDGYFGGSIGSIAVAASDHNVVDVGGGEVTVRGNWSPGWGAWRSTDAGKSWTSMGFEDAQCIPRLRVHPRDENLVYAAVLGHLFGPSDTRGVYRSRDGGTTWQRVLFVDENVGACDLLLDPGNPRIVWATTWRVRRSPYALESGGAGSGLWRSGDGGDTWTEFSSRPGLPGGTLGIIGLAISPANPQRMWAQVEAAEGGLFRSDDGGEHWSRVSDDHQLTQRAWYFSRIVADPRNEDVVYALNVGFFRSRDGGRTFSGIDVPHADQHDLWIDPDDPDRMIEANDGGACVSFDGGQNWSTLDNQPTAQFYRVATDAHFPWRVYGAQQDNSTVRLYPSGTTIGPGGDNWEQTAGGESGWLAPDPADPEVVYGGSYGGYLQRLDHATRDRRNVMVWPDNPMGWGAGELKYRFQWNYPLVFSRHDPKSLYAGANVLFRTRDEGQSWTAISPDLTRDDKSRMGPSGGPITKDNTSVEYYGTIFSLCESALEPGVIWCGSDDGLVQLTRDGGAHWSDVTPRFAPQWAQINALEPHPFEPGGVYAAVTRYKSDDFRPYLYRTVDYGRSWTLITNGIPDGHFTRVIRADPRRRGLLFAGTEAGIHVSFDDGDHWRPLQLDLPVVPITDLAIRDDTLVAATQGRSFWILDELNLLRHVETAAEPAPITLFPPRVSDWTHPRAAIDFFLKEKPVEGIRVAIEILDASGRVVRAFSQPKGENDDALTIDAGFQRLVWNRRWADAKGFPGLVLWGGTLAGPAALPGTYAVRLTVGGEQRTASLELRDHPRSKVTADEARESFEFAIGLRDLLTTTHESITKIRDLRGQLEQLAGRIGKLKECEELAKTARDLVARLTAIEEALYQTKLESGQDALNYPIKLNNKLADLYAAVLGNPRLTAQAKQFRAEIGALVDAELSRLRQILDKELPAFNRAAMSKQVPAIFVQGT